MADKKQEATVRDFLNVVFHRKYLILGVFLMTTVFIVYLKASQPQTYVSSSRVLVKRGERSDIFTLRPTYLTWAEEVASQIEVILSDAVFKRARVIFADHTGELCGATGGSLQGLSRFDSARAQRSVCYCPCNAPFPYS